MSIEAFNRLVKLTARAFYDDLPKKTENQPKTGRSDNRGIAVVVLDALTRRQWVREEDLAKDLKLHTKQLRRMLRFFEEEKLVIRDHRKETAKGAKIFSAAVAATADGHPHTKEGEEKIKLHTHSYCCLDYAQTYDVVRYRVHRMRKKLKDELEDKNTIQEYVCPNCGKRYNALDALQLISMEDEYFHCESCNGELVADSDKIASQEVGDGDSNARRQRREKIREMLQNLEVQLKPLIEQINRVKDLPPPEFGTLQAWEARAHAHRRAENGESSGDPSKSSNGAYGGTPMPFLGDTKVEVDFIKEGKDNDVKSESDTTGQKVLPPWMIKQGMNLTKEQRGEVNHEAKMDGTVVAPEYADDKKANAEDNEKVFQDEYLKAYWAAITKRREEEEEEAAAAAKSRQVGMKSKRDLNEADETEEIWEEAPVAPAGDANGNYKVNDLNVEADATAEEEDDDIDWEEG